MGENQYGLPDLRQIVAGRTTPQIFQETPQAIGEPFYLQTRNNVLAVPQQDHYEPAIMVGHEATMLPGGILKIGHDYFCSNNAANSLPVISAAVASSNSGAAAAATLHGLVEMEGGWGGNEGVNSNSRWPRQETLTLLEIRSRLNSRFKEANQKGPLWAEVSRIMAEEHGYVRSGKKCREKFENLYKYYRKTKEGKAGRQDGKNYRFFRQLEALYGETSNQNSAASAETSPLGSNTLLFQTQISSTTNQEDPEYLRENKHGCESISFSNTLEFETSSSENNDDDLSAIAYMMNRSMEKQKVNNGSSQCEERSKKNWKRKVKDFVDSKMRKVMETQEVWMENMLKNIEDREQARISRDEEWTKQEMARFDREHEVWAKERAWIQARDASLMEALQKYAGKGEELPSIVEQIALETHCHYKNHQTNASKAPREEPISHIWTEPETLSLIQISNTMEPRLQKCGYSKGGLWEEISEKMTSLGYDQTVDDCREKWEGLRRRNYLQQLEFHGSQEIDRQGSKTMKSASTSSSVGSQSQVQGSSSSSSFQGPIASIGGEHLWSKYGFISLS